MLTRSDDNGVTYTTPVRVNSAPEDTEYNGENRPKILVAEDGTVLLSWTTKTSPNFTGEIRFTRSTDVGKTFEPPRTLNDDGLMTGHRFDSLLLTASGKLYLTWIDKRDLLHRLRRSGRDLHAQFSRLSQQLRVLPHRHAIAVLGEQGEVSGLTRATVDDWFIDACPHHGPTMVQAAQPGQYHISSTPSRPAIIRCWSQCRMAYF